MSKKGRIFGIVNGKADMGKSYFVKQYLIPKLAKKMPVIVLDIIGEYEGENYKGFDEFVKQVIKDDGLEAGRVYVVQWTATRDAYNLANFLRVMEWEHAFIVEEAHMFFNNSKIKKEVGERFNELCYMGAHYGFNIILCTQTPYTMPPDARTQCQFIVSFKQTEQRDLVYLRQKVGAPDNTGEIVANLKPKQFLSLGTQPKGFDEIKINGVNQL